MTSGIRIGTPAVTSRGMKENEMREIADLITEVIRDMKNPATIESVRSRVRALCERFPLYPELG